MQRELDLCSAVGARAAPPAGLLRGRRTRRGAAWRLQAWLRRARPAAARRARRARRAARAPQLDGASGARARRGGRGTRAALAERLAESLGARRKRCTRLLAQALRNVADTAAPALRRDRLRDSSTTRTAPLLPSATTSRRTRWTSTTTTCWPRRPAWRASSRSRRATCPYEHWFHLGRPLGARARRQRAALVERDDVRVPDADAAAARGARTRCSAQSCDAAVRAQIDYARAARRPLGHLGVRLLPLRRPAELPVPRLRRARPRLQARARGRSGGRALRVAPRLALRAAARCWRTSTAGESRD